MIKHISDPLPRPSEFVPGLPDAVENVLFKALVKKPEDRYQTMGAFAAALEKIAASDQPVVVSKKLEEKAEEQEEKRKVFEKTNIRAVPTEIAQPVAGLKVDHKRVESGEATVQAPIKQVKPAQWEKPARPVRSFKLLIPIGIAVVALGIGIPLGIHFLKPGVGN